MRVLTIQDISCVGQCSLTVALPIISAMGIETSILPTAILSTHTAGFNGYTFKDLTDDMIDILNHWEKEKIKFDCVYTGYVGSIKQIDYIKQIYQNTKTDNGLLIVDPVMGDNGKLYPGFSLDFPQKMKGLCSIADIIIPNLTEASLLLNRQYKSEYTKEEIEDILHSLKDIGANKIVLTGVSFEKGKIGVATLDNDSINYYFDDFIGGSFHGTGDVYSSSFVGSIMLNKSLSESARIAARFVKESILKTIDDKDHWYGVKFESALPCLINVNK